MHLFSCFSPRAPPGDGAGTTEAHPEALRPAASLQPAVTSPVATRALLSDLQSDISRLHSAATLLALLPLPEAAALLSFSDSKSCCWTQASSLIYCKDACGSVVLPPTPGPAYRAVSLCASPGFQALFGARSSLACDVFFQQLMDNHEGARSFFTQVRPTGLV